MKHPSSRRWMVRLLAMIMLGAPPPLRAQQPAQPARNYELLRLPIAEARQTAIQRAGHRGVLIYIGAEARTAAQILDGMKATVDDLRPNALIMTRTVEPERLELYLDGQRCISSAVNAGNGKAAYHAMLSYCIIRAVQGRLEKEAALSEDIARLDRKYRQLLLDRARMEGRGLSAAERAELAGERNPERSGAEAREARNKAMANRRDIDAALARVPQPVLN